MVLIIFLSAIILVTGSPLPNVNTNGDTTSFSYILDANEGVNNLLEGDIVDTPRARQEIENLKTGKFVGYDAQVRGKWPKGVVPYTFGTINENGKKVVEYAIKEFNAKTCIRFIKRTNEADYVSFEEGTGCHSLLGRQGGRQVISIGKRCDRNYVAIHEMMHAIGFYHEQSRQDRDQFITINYSNIPTHLYYAFDKYKNGAATTHGEPYDKQSVMHYDRFAFAIDKKIPTITSNTDKDETLGNFVGFTQIDINQINKHYNCGRNPNTNEPDTVLPNTTSNPAYTTSAPQTFPPANCKDGNKQKCKLLESHCTKDFVANYCRKTCKKCS